VVGHDFEFGEYFLHFLDVDAAFVDVGQRQPQRFDEQRFFVVLLRLELLVLVVDALE